MKVLAVLVSSLLRWSDRSAVSGIIRVSHQHHITIQELQSCVQALTGEIRELKAAVCELHKIVQPGPMQTREAPVGNSVGEDKLPWNVEVDAGIMSQRVLWVHIQLKFQTRCPFRGHAGAILYQLSHHCSE